MHHDPDQAEAMIRSTQPDVLIIDHLYQRQDGLRILAALRTRPETMRLPVIVCFAATDLLHLHQGALANVGASVLAKPFALEDLIALVATLPQDGLPETRRSLP